VRRLRERFAQRLGAIECTELLGCEVSTAVGRQTYELEGLAERCIDFVAGATALTIEVAENGEDRLEHTCNAT
jgi:hypothetical protein